MKITVLTFQTLTALLKAERWLTQQAIPHRVEPAPREVTSDCGMAIMLDPARGGEARDLLARHGVGCELHDLEERHDV